LIGALIGGFGKYFCQPPTEHVSATVIRK
jgi:hypothetical protein